MTKLRNIGYLQFGSKIRQGFTVATASLTPRLSFFPLWMLFTANAGVGGPLLFILGGSLPPPCRADGLPAAPLPGGRGAAGSRPKYKTPPLPLRPHFLPTRSREGRGRVSEVIPPAKPCRILDPNRR